MAAFVVSKNGAILTRDGKLIPAGTRFETGKKIRFQDVNKLVATAEPFSDKQIEEFVRTRYIHPVEVELAPDDIPGTQKGIVLRPAKDDGNATEEGMTVRDEGHRQDDVKVHNDAKAIEEDQAKSREAAKGRNVAGQAKSPWIHDPESLKEFSLDDLNVLASEGGYDGSFSDKEEGVKFLSQDHK